MNTEYIYIANTYLLIYCYRWQKVGEISEIFCYPIKSCSPIRLTSIQCNQLGVINGNLRDRVFMIIDSNRNSVTARAYPHLLQIQPQIDNDRICLTAPNMPNIEISFNMLHSDEAKSELATIWNENVRVIDCGDDVAKWFSQHIHGNDDGFRLVYYPDSVPSRDCVGRNPLYKNLTNKDSVYVTI